MMQEDNGERPLLRPALAQNGPAACDSLLFWVVTLSVVLELVVFVGQILEITGAGLRKPTSWFIITGVMGGWGLLQLIVAVVTVTTPPAVRWTHQQSNSGTWVFEQSQFTPYVTFAILFILVQLVNLVFIGTQWAAYGDRLHAADFVCSPLPCIDYDYPLALGGWINRNVAGCTFFVPLFAGYVAIWYNELNPTFTPGYRAILAQLRSQAHRHTLMVQQN